MNTNGQEYWDQRSESYIKGIDGPYHANRLKMVEMLLENLSFANTRCLDFGCGEGVFTERLLADGAQVSGIDVDESMIRAARFRLANKGPATELIRGGVESMNALPEASFDFLFALNVLAYLNWLNSR
jgi:2-polyprenyl-3-methyl-5-hydroxy-6-metoxy-1,4-benzoquinol methylase